MGAVLGTVGSFFGLGGGAGGTGFAAPTGVPLQQGTNSQMAYDWEHSFENQVQGQNALLQALQGSGGIQNQQNVYGQMQGTAGQFQNLANGVGPNPAQAQLAQNTGQNVAQTGALLAGQRGGSQNVGQIARQVGQQGAAIQQQAAGQAATLGAQQQIAGLQGLQGQQQNLGNLATQQAGQQIGQVNQNTMTQQQQYQNLLNALGGYNQANVSMQGNINNANTQLANTKMGQQPNAFGGLGDVVGSAGKLLFGAQGGAVPTARSEMGQLLLGKSFESGGFVAPQSQSQTATKAGNSYSNDKIPAMLSEGEIVLPRSVTMSKNPSEAAARFVAAIKSRKGKTA